MLDSQGRYYTNGYDYHIHQVRPQTKLSYRTKRNLPMWWQTLRRKIILINKAFQINLLFYFNLRKKKKPGKFAYVEFSKNNPVLSNVERPLTFYHSWIENVKW